LGVFGCKMGLLLKGCGNGIFSVEERRKRPNRFEKDFLIVVVVGKKERKIIKRELQ
jgi:hypothetical protein